MNIIEIVCEHLIAFVFVNFVNYTKGAIKV